MVLHAACTHLGLTVLSSCKNKHFWNAQDSSNTTQNLTYRLKSQGSREAALPCLAEHPGHEPQLQPRRWRRCPPHSGMGPRGPVYPHKQQGVKIMQKPPGHPSRSAEFFSVSISRLFNFVFTEGIPGKKMSPPAAGARCRCPTSCAWPCCKASGVCSKADIPWFLLSKQGKPQCEHKALNISVVGTRRLCQNPEFLIAGFASHLSLNNAIKLCFKAAF